MYLPRASNPGKCSKAAESGGIRPGCRMQKVLLRIPGPAAQDGAKTLAAQITQPPSQGSPATTWPTHVA